MSEDREGPISAALNRVVELFAAICGDPDNPDLARSANLALAELNALLPPDRPTGPEAESAQATRQARPVDA